jgi:Tetratricopeptide repeat
VRLALRPTFLVGREKLLAEMKALLSAGDGAGPRIVVLCGLGGSGKTSTAVEYAHRHLSEFGVVWQFAAEEPAAMATEFAELVTLLGARNVLDGGDPVAQLHAILAARPGDWLLVFDNATSLAAVRSVLPPAGAGQVLVTSRDARWPGGRVLEVPVLEREVAAEFLQGRTGSTDAAAAGELADALGGLPLALEQAAAYMTASGRDIAGYLELFQRRRRDLLARGEAAGYGAQVATTWTLAFDELQRTAPPAIVLLRLLSCFAPQQVPLHLLLQPRPELALALPAGLAPLLEDPLAADDALSNLRRFSLVSAPRDSLVSVHRLVQAATLDQLDDGQAREWRTAARSIFEAAVPDDPMQPETWRDYAMLLPHAETVLPAESSGLDKIARFLGDSGSRAAARDLSRRVADARTLALGAEHPDTLTVRAGLAFYVGTTGDPAAARDLFADLLPVRERILGPEHPDTLTNRVNLARFIGDAGDPVTARDLYADLLPVLERVLGAEHPDTLTVRAGLAYWTGATGDLAAARDLFADLLPVRERILGPEHPDTLTVRAGLAFYVGATGDPAAARDLFADLLPVRERILGPEHPDTLTNRVNLARFIGEAGDPVTARDLFADLLTARERVLGAEHQDTLSARGGLARWTGAAGDPVAARDQFAVLAPTLERVLGAEHPDTLRARAELAHWTRRADDDR